MTTPGASAGAWQRDPRTGWFALAAGAFGVLVVVVLLTTAWPAFARIDAVVSAATRSGRGPALTAFALSATFLGGSIFVVPVTALLMLWMATRRNWAGIVYVFMTVAVGYLLGDDILKNLVRRPRPVGVNIIPVSGPWSLPSAHTLAAFLLFATVCVVVMLNMPEGRHVKRWLAIASTALILVVGWSRVYLGAEWFGDVTAACLVGGAWWLFTTATYFGSVTEEKRATPHL